MAEFINHNSFLLFSAIVILITGGIVVRRGIELKRIIPFGILVVFVTAAFFAMRPTTGTDASAVEVTAQIGGGVPVLLEFQSQN